MWIRASERIVIRAATFRDAANFGTVKFTGREGVESATLTHMRPIWKFLIQRKAKLLLNQVTPGISKLANRLHGQESNIEIVADSKYMGKI